MPCSGRRPGNSVIAHFASRVMAAQPAIPHFLPGEGIHPVATCGDEVITWHHSPTVSGDHEQSRCRALVQAFSVRRYWVSHVGQAPTVKPCKPSVFERSGERGRQSHPEHLKGCRRVNWPLCVHALFFRGFRQASCPCRPTVQKFATVKRFGGELSAERATELGCRRPNGATLCQPRATLWESMPRSITKPQRGGSKNTAARSSRPVGAGEGCSNAVQYQDVVLALHSTGPVGLPLASVPPGCNSEHLLSGRAGSASWLDQGVRDSG